MTNKIEPTIVTDWDSMPPEVSANGEVFSTRLLCSKFKKMESAMREFVDRCEKGEIRSTKTQKQFREILSKDY